MITLKLKIKEQDIELTIMEAKILYDELSALFKDAEINNILQAEDFHTGCVSTGLYGSVSTGL